MSSKPRILIAVLNMGLGHATRSLPVIRTFLEKGWEVLLVSTGRAATFLQRELPQVPLAEGYDYGLRYSRRGALLPLRLLGQFPGFLTAVLRENRLCRHLVERFRPQAIFSDHCYGMCHRQVPSFLLAHQLQFALGLPGRGYIGVGWALHRILLNRFHWVFVPDFRDHKGGQLSGLLSAPALRRERFEFVGPLSSLEPLSSPKATEWEAFIAISGPEPQRSLLEEKIVTQLRHYSGGPVCVLLGRPESGWRRRLGRHMLYAHLPREQFQALIQQAALVVSRPGYSTLMELCTLEKKALFIPTPGQTEQGYLASRITEKQMALVRPQHQLVLERDLPLARQFPALTCRSHPRASAEKIYQRIASFCTYPSNSKPSSRSGRQSLETSLHLDLWDENREE